MSLALIASALADQHLRLAALSALPSVLGDLGQSFTNLTVYFRTFGAMIMGGAIMYGAYMWMFAGDEQTRVGKAKVLIGTGVIAGMIVFLVPTLAPAIWGTFQ